jgi:hypothetical protein
MREFNWCFVGNALFVPTGFIMDMAGLDLLELKLNEVVTGIG